MEGWTDGGRDGGIDGWMDGWMEGLMDGSPFPERGAGPEGWGCPLGATCAASWPGVGCRKLLGSCASLERCCGTVFVQGWNRCPAPLGTAGLPRRAGHGPHRTPKCRERTGSARGAEPLLARVCSRPARCPSGLAGLWVRLEQRLYPSPAPSPPAPLPLPPSPGLPRPRCPLGVLCHVGRICTMPGLCLWFVDGEL